MHVPVQGFVPSGQMHPWRGSHTRPGGQLLAEHNGETAGPLALGVRFDFACAPFLLSPLRLLCLPWPLDFCKQALRFC